MANVKQSQSSNANVTHYTIDIGAICYPLPITRYLINARSLVFVDHI